ncbi:retrovirus-related pol polyprotein from transposon 17.6 [Tanacetum coccineum]
MIPIKLIEVVVADGFKIPLEYVCKEVKWVVQGVQFCLDFLSMLIGGYCMVLGIQWLSTLGDIKCNFGQLSLEFMWENKLVKLKGYQRKTSLAYLVKNVNNGMIRPSQSKFSSPVVLVKKQDGSSKKVDYLGYVISGEGVSADPSKIVAIGNWPKPKNIKELQGFLRLTGYYRRFFQNYGKIAKPLTSLLKKGNFHWDLEATSAFQKLKEAMSHTLVLGLLNSEEPFIIETDASGVGLRAVLTISSLFTGWKDKIKRSMVTDGKLQALIDVIKEQPNRVKKYYLEDDMLLRKGRLVVGDDKDLRKELIEFFHPSGLGGHSGVHATTQRLARTDYWKGMQA